MKRLSIIVFLIALLALVPGLASATTYTVCASGCSQTTIQGVYDNTDLAAGDVIEVQADTLGGSKTYTENVVWGSNDGGTSGNSVTLRARSGDTITINGGGSGYGILIDDVSYVTVDGIKITNADEGIYVKDNSVGVTVSSCNIYTITNRGVFTDGTTGSGADNTYPDYIAITDNTFSDIGTDTAGACVSLGAYTTNADVLRNTMDGNVDGVVVAVAGQGHVIAYNTIHGMDGVGLGEDGIDIKYTVDSTSTARAAYTDVHHNTIYECPNQSGVVVHYGTDAVKIHNNEIYDAGIGIWLRSATTGTIDVCYNLIRANDTFGIYAKGTDSEPFGGIANIYNNDIVSNLYAGLVNTCINCTITAKNNILDGNCASCSAGQKVQAIWDASGDTFTTDYNDFWHISGTTGQEVYRYGGATYYTLAQVISNLSVETHSLDADPLFVSFTGNNFKLKRSSPCVDTGKVLSIHTQGVTTDLAGTKIWNQPDIGCYEYPARVFVPAGVIASVAIPIPKKTPWNVEYVTFIDGTQVTFIDGSDVTFL